MTNLLKQPPLSRLNVELCKKLYNIYLSNTKDLFKLPEFEERYPGKLEGILGSVSQTFSEVDLFPTIGASAAAYFVKISTQHPFRDGNKRMSVYFTDIFLQLNGIELKISWQEMYELAKFIVEKKENGETPQLLELFTLHVFSNNV
jgi:death-on-curing family protein